MAPVASLVFLISGVAVFAGGALPLALVGGLVGCLLLVIPIAEMAKHLPSAAGFATFVAHGMHPSLGFLVGWGYVLVESLIPPMFYLLLGNVAANLFLEQLKWPYEPWWLASAVAAALVIPAIAYFGIRVNTRAGMFLAFFQLGIFVMLAVWLIASAGRANTPAVFGTKYSTVEGFPGFTGTFAGAVLVLLAFIGFESSVPLAEDASNPRRLVRVSLLPSVIVGGVFYILLTYAAVVAYGSRQFAGFAQAGSGHPWELLAGTIWGKGRFIIYLALVSSALGAANAGLSAAARTWYALGRLHLFPAVFGRTHVRWHSPYVAVLAQLPVGLGVVLWLGKEYNPVAAIGLLFSMVAPVMLAIFMAVNLSCVCYFWRVRRNEFDPIRHGVIPVAGVLVCIPTLFTVLGFGGSILSFIRPLPHPLSLARPALGAWFVLGVLYLTYLSVKHPDRLDGIRRVFPDEGSLGQPRR